MRRTGYCSLRKMGAADARTSQRNGSSIGASAEFELRRFVENTRQLGPWKYVPLLISYGGDFPEIKVLSAVQYDVAVRILCTPIMVPRKDTSSSVMASKRSIRNSTTTRRRFLKTSNQNTGSIENGNIVAQEEDRSMVYYG